MVRSHNLSALQVHLMPIRTRHVAVRMNSLQNHKMLNVMVAALVATATVAATAT